MKSAIDSDTFGDLIRMGLFALFFLGLALWIRSEVPHSHIDSIRNWILLISRDPSPLRRLAGFCAFVMLGGLLISVGFPRIWFSAVAGAVYGLALGIPAAMIASIVGSAVLFWMGKTFLGDMVRRRTTRRLAGWRAGLQENAFWWVLYLRLFPFANATATSLLCGSCRVPFTAFATASLIGFLPYTIMFAAFGNGGFQGNLPQILIGFAPLGATILARKCVIAYHARTGKVLP